MTDETPRPKRLTLSDVLSMVLTRPTGGPTVSLTRTAAGDVTFDVRATADTLAEAGQLAEAEFNRLDALYPRKVTDHQPAVSMSRNAKGDTQLEVKGVGLDATIAAYDKARGRYPMGNGATARPGSVAE